MLAVSIPVPLPTTAKSLFRSGFRRTPRCEVSRHASSEKFGGPGLSLAEVCREQRRLAYHAPATALAVNMHLYWVGVAADLCAAEINRSNGC